MFANKLLHRAAPVLLLISLTLWSALAHSGSLRITPVRVNLSAEKPLTVVTIKNEGSQPSVIQVETLEWSQEDGEDKYAPTRDLLVTPPIFTVPGGASQILRMTMRPRPPVKNERSYRLFLQEIPSREALEGVGLRMALRIGVPVFVAPADPRDAELNWSLKRLGSDRLELNVANTGNLHARYSGLRLSFGENFPDCVPRQTVGYVLPGVSRQWDLECESGRADRAILFTVDSVTGEDVGVDVWLDGRSR